MYADTPQFCHFITTAAMILHLTFSGRGAASLILYLTYYSKLPTYNRFIRRGPGDDTFLNGAVRPVLVTL